LFFVFSYILTYIFIFRYLHYLYDVHEDHLERTENLLETSAKFRKANVKSKNLEKSLSDLKLSSYNLLYEKMIISAHKVITNAYVFVSICKSIFFFFFFKNIL